MIDLPPTGQMAHDDIATLVRTGVVKRFPDGVQIGQDTVKLHVSDVAWVDEDGSNAKVDVLPDRPLEIPPGGLATVVTQEWLNLDWQTGGIIFPRGRILPVGAIIPTTHIDPGFKGHLRLVVFNLSPNLLTLPVGYELGRATLLRLPRGAPGAYHGVNAELRSLNPRADELIRPADDTLVGALQARLQILEDAVGTLMRRREKLRRRLVMAAVGFALLAAIGAIGVVTIIAAAGPFEAIVAVVAGGIVLGLGGLALRPLLARLKVRIDRWITS